MPACKLLTSLLASTLAVAPLTSVRAASPLVSAHAVVATAATRRSLAPQAEQTAAILGLDAEDEDAGSALSTALRHAFSRRGLGGTGQTLSLAEVRLTMGCEGDKPECLAQAGLSLGVEKLVYGYLRAGDGDGYSLELAVVGVDEGVIEAETKTPLESRALHPDAIEATAQAIVASLFPDERDPTATILPSPRVTNPPPQADSPSDTPAEGSKIVWGKYKPRPAWKWAGFGVSLGVTVLAGAAAIGSGIALLDSNDALLRKKLLDAADASLTDGIPGNDVDPQDELVSDDLCGYARTTGLDPARPDAVLNASVTKVCNQADSVEVLQRVAIGIGAVALVSTVVFTTLLFAHRRKPGETARRARRFRLGAGPSASGFNLGASWKF